MFEDLELSNAPYSQLVTMRDQLEEYVLLDMTDEVDDDHLMMLFDLSERLLLPTCIQTLHNLISARGLTLSSRLQAAEEYHISISSNDDLLNRFDTICSLLETAIREEEDTNRKAIATFANYYLSVLDIHEMWLPKLRDKISNACYQFLSLPEIGELLSFDFQNRSFCYDQIQQWKDELLGRVSTIVVRQTTPANTLLIETGNYADEVDRLCNPTFQHIRAIAVRNTDYGEQLEARGVEPLLNEHEMYIYMKSYGNMHYAKMQSAVPYIESDALLNEYELVDWGCGQGIGSMSFLEYCKDHQLRLPRRVTLVEPSEIALRRAALHVRTMCSTTEIRTICSGFDELRASQIVTDNSKTKIHLFSNVLDVELYNIHSLESVVLSSQQGINYFLCVSPHINVMKTARIRAFENALADCANYRHIVDVENSAGTWQGNWTRVLRVFAYGENSTPASHQNNVTQQDGSYDVFISYSVKDYKDSDNRIIPNNVITQIQNTLSANGITYWIDNEGLAGGDAFPQRIAEHIHNAKAFLFVSSRNSNQSPWTMNEIATASAYHKPIIPFRLDMTEYAQSIMFYLASLQYICYEGNTNAMQELVRALNRNIN